MNEEHRQNLIAAKLHERLVARFWFWVLALITVGGTGFFLTLIAMTPLEGP